MPHPAHTLTPSAPTTRAPDRWLALGAVAGPVVFTLAWFVLGFVSPGFPVGGDWISPYSPVAHPISGLGMGVTAPYMNGAFVLGGLLLLAGVVGVFRAVPHDGRPAARRTCLALLALAPLGLVVAGVFDLDHDLPHFLGFGLAAGSPVVSFAVAGRYLRGIASWRRFGTWLLAASPLTLALVVLYFLSFDEAETAAGRGVAGLTSRVLAVAVLAWFVAMGWSALRRSGR